ncbi:putative DNA repair protein [Mariprofundus aestuarium]|uniref:Putative DNA repair protein n=1 Tax=Mariprofundus aestuarium TaxID=1921086 RepID=A0A2K8KYK7_MARES|nr:PD-(D/E)XK nuclease family protein [Mariprofundus aestuarium]ATX79852.1 putative DNA repair protein [Mariprofundus aestuarium]
MQPSLFDVTPPIGEIAAADVTAALEKGALLLTASATHAIDWKRRITTASVSPVSPTPCVSSWQEWISELVESDTSLPVTLNRMQEMQLWEQVIRADLSDGSQSLSSIRGLARHAREAWAIMQQYRIPLSELEHAGEEAESLLRWVREMKTSLQEERLNGRLLAADQVELLLPRIHQLIDFKMILLDGFEAFSPQQDAIMQAFLRAGVRLQKVRPEPPSDVVPAVISCPDELAELNHISGRITDILSQSPQARIALLTSDAISDLSPLKRKLTEALIPEDVDNPAIALQAVTMPGERLTEGAMIKQLLFVLGLAGESNISFSDFSRLLFLPWLKGYESERFARAELDRVLRQQNRHHISLSSLLESQLLDNLPELAAALTSLIQWKASRQRPSEWVKRVHKLLQDTGFVPSGFGEVLRSNDEIRLINSFRDALGSLVSLDAVNETMSWSRLLSMLRSADAKVRAEVCHPNVVVMPLDQVVGLRFDYIFVAGLEEQVFPMNARTLALLPLPVQQKYAISMSQATLAFESSRFIWQQLLAAAPHIEISYALQRGEQESRLSPFARGAVERECESEAVSQRDRLELEFYEDAPALPLQDQEQRGGGTALIKDQSACPFKAFARHRLMIRELGDSSPGIEPSTKGSLLHLALEFIWTRLQTAERLQVLDEESRRDLIDEAITSAWQQNRASVPASLREIEVRRMQSVLFEWLELESSRPPFQLLSIEKPYRLLLPEQGSRQFPISIKADRIDRDAHGRRILIDYKTGAKQSVSKWVGERIEEPQLPLYAMAADLGEDDAVSYARVRSGEMGFEGLAAEDIGIRGITPCDGKRNSPDDWSLLLQSWRENINALAEEFAQGRCDVSPRDEQACNYCGLEAVCRIEETGFDRDAGDES